MERNSRLVWLVSTFVCVLGFDLGAAGADARLHGHSDPEPIVRIDGGRVQGVAVPGGYVFRALPYAAPPTGRQSALPRSQADPQSVRESEGSKTSRETLAMLAAA